MKQQNRPSEFSLRPEKLRTLISAADSPRNRLIITLFAFTGIRRAELQNLDSEDIFASDQRILIRDGKGGKSRLVFYPMSESEVLARYLDRRTQGALFPGRHRCRLTLRSINNIVAGVGKLAGIPHPNPRYKNISPHLFRHSFARNWKRSGGSLESLRKILGHASIRTTFDLYGTESVDETADNYQAMADRLVAS